MLKLIKSTLVITASIYLFNISLNAYKLAPKDDIKFCFFLLGCENIMCIIVSLLAIIRRI